MNTTILKFLLALISFVLLCFGYRGLTKREVSVKGGFKISKEEKPTAYWINIIVYLVAGAAGILFALIS